MFPERITTERLTLRAPRADDAAEIFARYASDPEVTRYLAWPTHRSLDDTRAFLDFAARARADGAMHVWLVVAPDGALLGSTGLNRHGAHHYETGYVFAVDAWGKGYATEVARKMAEIALSRPEVRRVSAQCHVDHAASARVLEKAGFVCEGVLRRAVVLPNLSSEPSDVACYSRIG